MHGKFNSPRLAAGALTIIFLLVAYFLLNVSALPRRDMISQKYDDINWTRFVPKPITLSSESKAASPSETTQPNPPEAPVQRMELTEVLQQLPASSLRLETRSPQSPGKHGSTTDPMKNALDLDLSTYTSDNPSLVLGEDTPLPSNQINRRGTNSSAGNIAIASDAKGEPGIGLGSFGDDTGADIKGPAARGAGGGNVKIALKKLDDFGEGYSDFSEIYKPLVEWMRLHPAELPDVVKRFMDYKEGNLTSLVNFTVDARSFEMFLLCIEQSYEVRIALVEAGDVTYLIDQGFRRKSNFLRVGAVDRLDDATIFKFGTNLRPASDARAAEFYQIFLSWWETVKHEVEK